MHIQLVCGIKLPTDTTRQQRYAFCTPSVYKPQSKNEHRSESLQETLRTLRTHDPE